MTPENSAIECMERVATTMEWEPFVLPSKRRVIVIPDLGLEALQKALADPEFAATLKTSLQELRDGQTETLPEGFFD